MGLSSKQVNSSTSTDGLDCSHTFLQTQPNLQLPKTSSMRRVQQQQQQQQQQNSELLKCPRCDSTNTKFCYYNNYNKTQPRHFCRACKRHWTKGGTLRNVPLGGGRKNKRTKKPTTSSSVSSALVSTQMTFQPQNQSQTLPLIYHQNLITTSEPFVQKQNLNFPFLSSSSFDSKLISVSNPSQTSSSSCFYNHVEELKFIEEPEICNIDMPNTNMMSTLTQQPIWQVPITSNSGIDMSNNWNWEDIDFDLVSTDINLAWDDSDIKP